MKRNGDVVDLNKRLTELKAERKAARGRAAKERVESTLESAADIMASDPGFQQAARKRSAEREMSKHAAGAQLFQPGDLVRFQPSAEQIENDDVAIPPTWVGTIVDHEWYNEDDEKPAHYYNVRWRTPGRGGRPGETHEGFYAQDVLVAHAVKNPARTIPLGATTVTVYRVGDSKYDLFFNQGDVVTKSVFEAKSACEERARAEAGTHYVIAIVAPRSDVHNNVYAGAKTKGQVVGSALLRPVRNTTTNPGGVPEIVDIFNELIACAPDGSFPEPVQLVVDDETALQGRVSIRAGGRACACADAGTVYIVRALLDAGDERQTGILAHELAHVHLLQHGKHRHSERQADRAAWELFGLDIGYDKDDVQTTAELATRPRPQRLDTRANPGDDIDNGCLVHHPARLRR